MLFRAQNLGPIRDAELDLSKSLIILAGPNNSGKTYLGWALYGLSWFNRALPCVRELVDAAIASPTGSHDAGPYREFWIRFMDQLCEAYTKHIHRDFAAPPANFSSTSLSLVASTRLQRGGASLQADRYRFSVRLYDDDAGAIVLSLHARDLPARREAIQAIGDSDLDINDIPLSEVPNSTLKWLARNATLWIINILKSGVFGRGFTIFPVERIATTIFARELLLRHVEMVDDDNMTDTGEPPSVVPSMAGRYPLPVRHSLLAAADLAASSREESGFRDLAEELEGSVLQGRFVVGEHGDMLFIPSSSPQQALGLHQSASVVKSLSSLVYYFRHLARKRDHIIIDEPELNLHPDNQRRVARVLAKAANRGINIMMSTHSDYLIGEFNNLLMLGRDTPQAAEVRQELGYDVASVLKPEKVGVYLVSDGLCKPVEVKETGFEIKTFEDAFHSMNRDAQTIFSRVFAESE